MTEVPLENVPLVGTDLAHVLERITDGFFALDSAWRIAYMNAEARNLLRAGDRELTGMPWLDAFPRLSGTAFERNYARAMREQHPVQFTEFYAVAQRWLDVKAYPSPDGLSIYFRDATARLRAERELEARSAQLQAVIAFGRLAFSGASMEQLWTDAIELLAVYIDVPIVEIHRYDRDDDAFRLMASQGWGEHEALRAEIPRESQAQEARRRGQAVVTSDVRIDPRFGDRRGFAEAGARAGLCVLIGTVDDPVGLISAYSIEPRVFTTNDVRFVESVATIVGEATRTEQERRRVVEVLESITDAFAGLDHDLRITYVNQRMAELLELPAQEARGRPIAEVSEFGAADPALEHYRVALATRRPVTHETYSARRDRWFESRIYPTSDGLSVYLRDVTERKISEIRMREMNEELERRVVQRTMQLELANKELESFAYSVSHDLRAPLRAIDGFSQAIEEDYGAALDGGARGYLQRVRAAAKRMADLIDALLTLARVARVEVRSVRVDLSALATEILADLASMEPGRDVRNVVEEGLEAVGEPMLLRAVLENLLGNAWKFTRHSRDATIAFGRHGPEYYVRDNGAGFDMAYENKLFGAFQRLHSADEYEGTGIGLATVARIVHRHGGTIRAEGSVGAGAAFYFTLAQEEGDA